jgi:CheY-like chemotaxis protein
MARLAGGLSHRLNDMLTAILGNTSLVLADFGTDLECAPSRRLLEDVEVASQTAAELVQRMVMFAAYSAGAAREKRELDLNTMIPECLDTIRLQLSPRIRATFVPASHVRPIHVDPQLIGQALVELATNAQQAMRQGGQLTIELDNVTVTRESLPQHPQGQVGHYVRLRVSDTGRGIPVTMRDGLLEPFGNSADWSQGRGLGLPLVLAVAEQHHGWVEIHSHVGRGTRIDMFLPSDDSELPAVEAPPEPPNPSSATKTILLADGDPLVRDVGRRILEGQGYHVLVAEDGGEAIAMYRRAKERIDLAILDLNMPRLTAYVVLERLLAIDPQARVLFSGGFLADEQFENGGHTLGVIPKPFSARELVEAVGRALTSGANHC